MAGCTSCRGASRGVPARMVAPVIVVTGSISPRVACGEECCPEGEQRGRGARAGQILCSLRGEEATAVPSILQVYHPHSPPPPLALKQEGLRGDPARRSRAGNRARAERVVRCEARWWGGGGARLAGPDRAPGARTRARPPRRPPARWLRRRARRALHQRCHPATLLLEHLPAPLFPPLSTLHQRCHLATDPPPRAPPGPSLIPPLLQLASPNAALSATLTAAATRRRKARGRRCPACSRRRRGSAGRPG